MWWQHHATRNGHECHKPNDLLITRKCRITLSLLKILYKNKTVCKLHRTHYIPCTYVLALLYDNCEYLCQRIYHEWQQHQPRSMSFYDLYKCVNITHKIDMHIVVCIIKVTLWQHISSYFSRPTHSWLKHNITWCYSPNIHWVRPYDQWSQLPMSKWRLLKPDKERIRD